MFELGVVVKFVEGLKSSFFILEGEGRGFMVRLFGMRDLRSMLRESCSYSLDPIALFQLCSRFLHGIVVEFLAVFLVVMLSIAGLQMWFLGFCTGAAEIFSWSLRIDHRPA